MPARVVPTVAEIERAAAGLDPVFAHSPLLCGTPLDDETGARVALKVESLNPIRSFKGRGAVTWMREAGAGAAGVVCASAGNFGQGLAYAARAAGIPCHVFVGATANAAKVAAMRRLGARVVVGGEDYDAAIATAREFASDERLQLVQDGREPWIAAGAGTMAVELTGAGLVPDVALVPVGNSATRARPSSRRSAAPTCRPTRSSGRPPGAHDGLPAPAHAAVSSGVSLRRQPVRPMRDRTSAASSR